MSAVPRGPGVWGDAVVDAGLPERCATLLIGALGGEGGGVLTDWIVEAARAADLPVQATSIPGVAQRTGATTYYVELYPSPRAMLGGLEPVMCLSPTPGRVDVFLCSEAMEAARALGAGFVSGATTVIASTHRVLATVEKMAMGDGRFDAGAACDALRAGAGRAVLFDMQAERAKAGTAVSAVMLGALLGSGVLPLRREHAEAAIRASGRGVEASLRGFAAGFERATGTGAGTSGEPSPRPLGHEVREPSDTTAPGTRRRAPLDARRAARIGEARCADYLDRDYAACYRERLARLVAAWPGDETIGREGARFLALLMCYEDVARVAALKARADRFERIRAEARAAPGDPVRVVEYFKPGWDELADLLPPRPAARLRAWAARRGRVAVLARGVALESTSIRGLLALRLLAGARAWRRRSSRFAAEDALVERWIAAIAGAPDVEVAREVALAARLVKGYSDTHRRGRGNFERILATLVEPAALPPTERARAIRAAREAALAGPEPQRLDDVLAPLGIAPRPPREVSIRIVRRTPSDPSRRPSA